jgi:copper chaperone NosL
MKSWHRPVGVLAVIGLIAACQRPAPRAIHYGVDACDRCRMTIADPAFAAQLVTRTGKTYHFDDPGCLLTFVSSGRVPARDVHSVWVNDHENPDSLVNVRDAVFVASDRIKAPMNGHLAAFATRAGAEAAQMVWGGRIETWDGMTTRGRP